VRKLVEKARYAILLAVLAALAASVLTLATAVLRMGAVLAHLVQGMAGGEAGTATAEVAATLDALLLAVVLYIFAAGLYELFIGELSLPEWLVIHDLGDLKSKLVSVIILLMAVTFLEHLVQWRQPLDTLLFGAATAAVVAVLVLYLRLGEPGSR